MEVQTIRNEIVQNKCPDLLNVTIILRQICLANKYHRSILTRYIMIYDFPSMYIME